MKRKVTVAAVLCLGTIGLLCLAASPVLAQDGCDCHTAVPPTGGAPAAHAALVAGITDCTVCHQGMTTQPHPDVFEATIYVSGAHASGLAQAVSGGLYRPWMPLAGVRVYVQGKADDESDYSMVGEPVTTEWGFFRASFSVTAPPRTYRAISQGLTGPPVVKPAIAMQYTEPPDLPAPGVTLAFTGLSDGVLKLGRSVIVVATVTPVDMAGQEVRLNLQKWIVHRVNSHWSSRWNGVNHVPGTRTIRADGTCRWKLTPRLAGKYRVKATIRETAAYDKVITAWKVFRVK